MVQAGCQPETRINSFKDNDLGLALSPAEGLRLFECEKMCP